MKFLVLAILSALPQQSFAYYKTSEETCKTVDFRNEFSLKMRNQNQMAWCYAHSAADYLQYTYQIDEQISAADIAILYSKSKWSRFATFIRNVFTPSLRGEPPQTGIIKYAIQMIRPQGYCPESSLPSDEWTRVEKDGQSSKVEILKAAMDLFELQAQVKVGKYPTPADLPWRYEFKNLRSANAFYDLMTGSTQKTILTKLRAQACTPDRKAFPKVPLATTFQLRGPKAFVRINNHLNLEKAPVTIDFFSDVLKNYDNPRRSINNMHTVVLYGRKYDVETQQCQYMLKDSYGEQCTKYDPKIKCEGGYVWLPENKLYPLLFSSFTMKRK